MYNVTIKIKIAPTHMSVRGGEVLSEKAHMSKILVVYIKVRFELLGRQNKKEHWL